MDIYNPSWFSKLEKLFLADSVTLTTLCEFDGKHIYMSMARDLYFSVRPLHRLLRQEPKDL